MKQTFSFSDGHSDFKILTHKGLYYLYFNEGGKPIARAENEKVLRSHIDGYSRGYDIGYSVAEKRFKK